ncbi:helix-turn-helix domain-containing protein [Sphingomonas sp. UYP23]
MRHAQMLMLHTDDTLSHIACACGLTDQAHLTRLFRRMVGETPLVWRRAWGEPV